MGAARFIRGLTRRIPEERLTVIVNTGDDEDFHGLHVSPDIDTIVYTLARVVHPAQGWGLAHDSFRVLEALARFYPRPWFRLGDRDLATHIYRTDRLRSGAKLSEITAEIARRFHLSARVLPMSDDNVRTFVKLRGCEAIPFQDYLVRQRARGAVEAIELRGIEQARPLPAALEAIGKASVVVLAPSNPFVSLGPILGLAGMRECLRLARERVAAISPIVRGKTIKGPADKMLRGLGMEVSALGVARLYRDIAGVFVLDKSDADLAESIRHLGMTAVAADTIMSTPAKAARLADVVLNALAV